MATPSELLATSLEALKALQDSGVVAIRSSDLTRTHRERLQQNGFLTEVFKGWYVASRNDLTPGDTTPWYTAFWDFCAQYLNDRFGNDWSVSAEQSLLLHAKNTRIPQQLLIRSLSGGNNVLQLMHGTSLMDIQGQPAEGDTRVSLNGVLAYRLEDALSQVGPDFYRRYPTDARNALMSVQDASVLLSILLDEGKTLVAGRLAGAFRNIGRDDISDEILATFKSIGYAIRESDPFESPSIVLASGRPESPYASRIRIMWHEMRDSVLEVFGDDPGMPEDEGSIEDFLKRIDDVYVTDAYHSLSIEGYQVSTELIEKVRSGSWDPDNNLSDRELRNALAARGYYEAFMSVKNSIHSIFDGRPAGDVVQKELTQWYRSLFAPSVTAGILKPADLAGYRNMPVYIRGSKHAPPNAEGVRDTMPALFELIGNESSAAVRAVLGHFLFVYTHPFMDGNGRTGRFLMNTMLASGGYNWTVIPVERRDEYMQSLEAASVEQNIEPFAELVADLQLHNRKTPKRRF